MRREYDGTVLWGTRYKIEKISGLISQQGQAGNRTVNYCGGIIPRCVRVNRESAGTARATLYDGVGSVKRHLGLTSFAWLVPFLLKRIFFFPSTKARS